MDNKANLVSIKVSGNTLDWIEDQKTKARRLHGKKPTAAQLIDVLVDTHKRGEAISAKDPSTSGSLGVIADAAKIGHALNTEGLTPEELKKVEAFIGLIRDGDAELLSFAENTLRIWKIRNARKAREEAGGEGKTGLDKGAGKGRRSTG